MLLPSLALGLVVCVYVTVVSGQEDAYCSHRSLVESLTSEAVAKVIPSNIRGENGLTDILVHTPNGIILNRVRPDGTLSSASSSFIKDSDSFCPTGNIYSGDVNGDHLDDIICHDPLSGAITVSHKERNGYGKKEAIDGFTCPDSNPTASSNSQLVIGDFDGNGADDLLCFLDTSTNLAGSVIYLNSACYIEAQDYHNDHFHRSHHHSVICKPKQAVMLTVPVGMADDCLVAHSVHAGDYNGDGKDDIICYNPSTEFLAFTSQTTDTAVSLGPPGVATACADKLYFPFDVDGDGDDDAICYGAKYGILESDGSTFAALRPALCGDDVAASITATDCFPANLNGDGKDDLVCYESTIASANTLEMVVVYAERQQS